MSIATHPAKTPAPSRRPTRPTRIEDPVRGIAWHGFPAAAPPADAIADSLTLRGLSGEPGLLERRTLVCMGLGAVNGRVFQELARLGVGRLYGVDMDRYGRDSWLTQPCRRGIDEGRAKAAVQAAAANAINPACGTWAVDGQAQDAPLAMYARADLLIVSGDNAELSAWAGSVAAALGKPLLELAVFGEGLAAVVRAFDLGDPAAPCPACLMSAAEWQNLKSRQGCDPATMRALGQEPTRTQPMTCALAAQLGVAEALKSLLGVEPGRRLSNEELIYSMVSHRAIRTPYGNRNPACRCPHRAWRVIAEPAGTRDVTLGDLVRRYERLSAEEEDRPEGGLLQIRGELPWISFTLCEGCGVRRAVRRFGKPAAHVGRCACGCRLRAVPLGVRGVLPQSDVEACRDRTLAELGLPADGAVGMAYGEQWAYFFLDADRPLPWAGGQDEGRGTRGEGRGVRDEG